MYFYHDLKMFEWIHHGSVLVWAFWPKKGYEGDRYIAIVTARKTDYFQEYRKNICFSDSESFFRIRCEPSEPARRGKSDVLLALAPTFWTIVTKEAVYRAEVYEYEKRVYFTKINPEPLEIGVWVMVSLEGPCAEHFGLSMTRQFRVVRVEQPATVRIAELREHLLL